MRNINPMLICTYCDFRKIGGDGTTHYTLCKLPHCELEDEWRRTLKEYDKADADRKAAHTKGMELLMKASPKRRK